jgi:hypothetical protein
MRILEAAKRYLRSPAKIVLALGSRDLMNWLPDRTYLKLAYRGQIGKKLKIDAPVTYNEKLQWLKLYDRKPEYSRYVDKYEVQQHIRETIGEKYLIPMLGLYSSVEEIDWDSLPDRFVLKCTHGSGTNIICTDKDNLDTAEAEEKLRGWMKRSWYWYGREWPYRDVKPRIICQEFISDSGRTPDDYKVLCFNGKAKFIEVHMDRFGDHKQDLYDEGWNKVSIIQGMTPSELVYEKPACFDEMMRLSEELAADMYHVRIDWFVVDERLYFGEITFYDGAGFYAFDKVEDDRKMGNLIHLPTDKQQI